MKSRITIEVDFENGNEPVIQIKQYFTDDVRDKLLSSFLQRRAHQSSWLRIDHIAGTDDHNLLRIRALTPDQLPEQARLMTVFTAGGPSRMERLEAYVDAAIESTEEELGSAGTDKVLQAQLSTLQMVRNSMRDMSAL